jgi:hypothetical protein
MVSENGAGRNVRAPQNVATATAPPDTIDSLAALGWPFAQMGAAALAHDDAKKREWAARVAGDVSAREEAIFDQSEALAARQKARDDLTAIVIGGLRIAGDDQPVALAEQINRVIEQSPIVRQMRTDIEALADAVAELQGRAPRMAA